MHQINVSLVYATPARQWLFETRVARGTSALELVELSGFQTKFNALMEFDTASLELGIYAQKIALDHLLEEGDRVEIYRPLTADPKEVRRQLALMGKTMGKSSAKDDN